MGIEIVHFFIYCHVQMSMDVYEGFYTISYTVFIRGWNIVLFVMLRNH